MGVPPKFIVLDTDVAEFIGDRVQVKLPDVEMALELIEIAGLSGNVARCSAR